MLHDDQVNQVNLNMAAMIDFGLSGRLPLIDLGLSGRKLLTDLGLLASFVNLIMY